MEAVVLDGQGLIDIAIQYTGDAKNAIDIAKANAIDLTDYLEAGTILIVPDELVSNQQIVKHYQVKNITPARASMQDVELDRIFGQELPEQFS